MPTTTKVTSADPSIVPVEGPVNNSPGGVQKQIPRPVKSTRTQRTRRPESGLARDDNENQNAAAASPYGVNYENLPERLQEALRRLVLQFSTESESSRRQEVRRIKQAHQFWRGLQYLWWDERDQNWHLPFEQKMMDSSSLEDMPRYEFVTNIYQAFGLSLVSVLSQDVPTVRFFPSSAQAEEDVSAAKAATEVAGLVERNNRIGNLIVEEAFNLWTDGKVGAYVRFVVDGQRFGFHPETEIAAREVRLGDDVYVCPDCGHENAAEGLGGRVSGVASGAGNASEDVINSSGRNSSTLSSRQRADVWPDAPFASRSILRDEGSAFDVDLGDTTTMQIPRTASRAPENRGNGNGARDSARDDSSQFGSGGTSTPYTQHPTPDSSSCSECGALLTEENFVAAETITVPAAETRLRVPNGQEVITIVGGLELKTPPWAGEMHEYPYLQWNMEVHQARLRAAYPHAADKIGAPVASGMQEYERLARLAQSQGGALTGGGDSNMNLITFQRTWLRPWAFFALDDKALRDELLQLFPDGAYVALAGDIYCESRNENMDDHWRVLHALPGDGSSGRPALGDSLISVQERFNTLSNLQMETYEYGIPPIYADSEVLDFDSLQNQSSEPGVHYPARAKPGQSLAAGFFQPAPAEVPPDLSQHAANLMGPIAQFLTGAFPALFGGSMTNTDTAAGYSMARDQAMGRIGLVWRRMKFFHADLMLLAVDCFRRNRPNDVEVTLLGAGAAFESKWIRLADLKGNLFSYPETDEQYPTLWAQQRAVLLQLISNPDPQIQSVLSHPENMALIKRMIGLEQLVVPDEESRTKQYREIAQLVGESPVVVRSDAATNPGATPQSSARHPEERSDEGPLFVSSNRPGSQPQRDPSLPSVAQDDGFTPTPAVPGAPALELVLPSIMPDEFADNHAVELEICMRWFSADAGQVAKIEAPAGYANVRAHAMFHREFLLKQQPAPSSPSGRAATQAQQGTTPPRSS